MAVQSTTHTILFQTSGGDVLAWWEGGPIPALSDRVRLPLADGDRTGLVVRRQHSRDAQGCHQVIIHLSCLEPEFQGQF